MGKKSAIDRKIVEKYYGKKLTPKTWKGMKPEPDEDLNEIAKALPPRIAEREFELAGAVGAYQNVARIAEAEEIQKWVNSIRRSIFGKNTPPFSTAQAALKWIEREHFLWHPHHLTEAEWERYPYRKRIRAFADGLGRLFPTRYSDIDWNTFRVWWPADQLPRHSRSGLAFFDFSGVLPVSHPKTQGALNKDWLWLKAHPGDGFTRPVGPQLIKLALWSEDLAVATRCWTFGEATSFILTGTVPNIPRFRVWTEELPGGGKRAFVEIYGAVNPNETRELAGIIRRSTETFRKKSYGPEDLRLIEFVQPLRGKSVPWKKILQTWNKQHPKRRFRHPSILQNAYNRAKARETRP